MSKPRTLIIGLDGATFDLIDSWAAMGHLPALARLVKDGVRAPLRAFPNMNSASAWTSIVTGCNPGKHGIYDFGDDRTVYDRGWRPTSALDRRRPPFWQVLSAARQHVGVINVPISYPADAVDGFMISGMYAPGTSSVGFAHPEWLLADLLHAGIDYVLDVPHLARARRHDPYRLPSEVREMVEARAQAALLLMREHRPDAMMVVFTATDRMQHAFWGSGLLAEDGHTWRPLLELYKQLDTWIARLCEQAGPDTNVIVVSDHGFGPYHHLPSLVNPLFAQLGWLSYRSGSAGRSRLSRTRLRSGLRALRDATLKSVLVMGRRWLPGDAQIALAKRFPKWRQQALHARSFPDIDWATTQVYAHVMGGGIMVRPAVPDSPHAGGCNAHGYDALCDEVRAALLELRDPATGVAPIREVWHRDDLYAGPHLGRAPDMQIEWNEKAWEHLEPPSAASRRTSSLASTTVAPAKQGGGWKGRHRSRGIFITCGPAIQRGIDLPDDPSGLAVTHYDITPTLYYLQGLPIPDDLDGRVLTGILDPDHLARNPVARGLSTPMNEPREAPALGEREARQVEQRLRDLGYIYECARHDLDVSRAG